MAIETEAVMLAESAALPMSAMMESLGPETQVIAVLEAAMWVRMVPPGRKAHTRFP